MKGNLGCGDWDEGTYIEEQNGVLSIQTRCLRIPCYLDQSISLSISAYVLPRAFARSGRGGITSIGSRTAEKLPEQVTYESINYLLVGLARM